MADLIPDLHSGRIEGGAFRQLLLVGLGIATAMFCRTVARVASLCQGRVEACSVRRGHRSRVQGRSDSTFTSAVSTDGALRLSAPLSSSRPMPRDASEFHRAEFRPGSASR